MSLKKARELEPEINSIAENEEGVFELLELAERLEDLTRNVGMHAGGVLIAPGKLTDFTPLYCADGSSATVSQFDKDDVEKAAINYGPIEMRPLPMGHSAKRAFQPQRDADVGFGPGRGGTLPVSGGTVGVAIDGRGRPLVLPEDAGRRKELIKKWLWTVGG